MLRSGCFCFAMRALCFSFFFFFNDTATTEIYTLSLHDALPISVMITNTHSVGVVRDAVIQWRVNHAQPDPRSEWWSDRKSTRLNSSHLVISYAVFCLKKKKRSVANCDRLPRPYQRPRHCCSDQS